MRRARTARIWSAFLLAIAGCTPEASVEPRYAAAPPGADSALVFAVHPLHNPQRLHETYGPLVAFLNRRLGGARIEFEASRSYDDFERKLRARRFHLALPNPYEALGCLPSGYRIFGKMGDDERFRGIVLVRKDSGIGSVADLRGKTISFPAPTALAATMMPLFYLQEQGLDVNAGITRLFAGSQESSIMSVWLRRSAAGATWPPPWEAFSLKSPEVAAGLRVLFQTPPLVNNALVVRDDVPPEVLARVSALLFGLHEHPEGRQLLAALPLSRFEAADEAAYRPVRAFLARYAEVVR